MRDSAMLLSLRQALDAAVLEAERRAWANGSGPPESLPWKSGDPEVRSAWEQLTRPENLAALGEWGRGVSSFNDFAKACTLRAIAECHERATSPAQPGAAADPAPPRRPLCYHGCLGGAGPLSLGVRRRVAIAMHRSDESNKAVFRRAVDVWAAGDISALDGVVAPDYMGHTSEGDRDVDGLRQSIEAFHKLYSECSFSIEDQMIDGEKVITRLSAEVTTRDGGESAKLMGINISRIVGGKLVEEWNTWEAVGAPQRRDEAH